MARTLVTVALALYNNVANLWPPFNGMLYVPANIVASAALVAVAVTGLGLDAADVGVSSPSPTDALTGLLLGGLLSAPLLVLASTRRGAPLVADARVRHLRGRALAYQVLVRVPLGTALLEELAFRGVLFAAWRDAGIVTATVVSSVVFGLWHVAPAATMVRLNAPAAARSFLVRSVAGTVVVTALAGAALVWLRVETGSLLAPFALHASLNSLATVAGARAGARLRREA